MTDQYKADITKVFTEAVSEDQKVLYGRMKNGDTSARDSLVHSCLPLVYDIAQKFRKNNKHIDLEDMIQQGNLSLLKAVDNWDIARAKLTTIATWYIRNSLIDMIKESKYSLKTKLDITRHASDDMRKIRATNSDQVEEIQKITGLPAKRIKLLLRLMSSRRIDFDILNMILHFSEECESIVDSNINGCLADLIDLVEETIDDEEEKEIFFVWLRNIHKNNKARLTSEALGVSVQEVSRTVRKAKRALKKKAKEDLIHA